MSEETHFTPRSQNRHFEDPAPRAHKKQAKRQAPKGKKGKKNILLNVLLVFFCAVFVFSAYKLVSQYLVYQQADSEYEQVRELAGMPAGEQADSRPDFAALQAINPEIVGWVTVPGTVISYPVAQTDDNDKYLHTTFEGKSNASGCIFMDKDSQTDGKGQHTILYGHNMKNGSMFHELLRYKNAAFFNEHPTIYYDTPEGRIELRVIAAYAADANDPYNFVGASLGEFQAFLQKGIEKSPVQVDVDVTRITSAFSLQTCSYETDNSRTFVIAVPVSQMQP